MWQSFVKSFPLAPFPGFKICQVSMGANGVQWGTKAADDFIKREVDIHEAAGWQLVAIMPSEGKERINLRFADVNIRQFSCQVTGKITGEMSEHEMLEKLSEVGIINPQIINFRVDN